MNIDCYFIDVIAGYLWLLVPILFVVIHVFSGYSISSY
jgi:hypothetical protein